MSIAQSAHALGKVGPFHVCTRSDVLSSHAGLLLLQEFVTHLQVTQTIEDHLHLKVRQRGYSEAQAVLALVYNLLSGGTCLRDLEVLRGDVGTQQLLGLDAVLAPTTAGEFLRKFHIGHIRDLQRINGLLQAQVRPLQNARLELPQVCTIDLDSSVYAQASQRKQGSCKAYNGEIGYHPLLAFWAETQELLFSHLRRGSAHTSRKVVWFLEAMWPHVPEVSRATQQVKLRCDSGFYAKPVVTWCEAHGVTFSITADQTAPLLAGVTALGEAAWQDLEKYGVAQVAHFGYQPTGWARPYRYVVKREVVQDKQRQLQWKYHVFVTNDATTPATTLLEWHLAHANMENYIKEHKSGLSLEKLPSQSFHANWAYLLIGQLAYNLLVWFKRLVLPGEYHQARVKTIRHQLFNLAGKIVRTARQQFLILHEGYRYQGVWQFAINRLKELSHT